MMQLQNTKFEASDIICSSVKLKTTTHIHPGTATVTHTYIQTHIHTNAHSHPSKDVIIGFMGTKNVPILQNPNFENLTLKQCFL